MHLAWTATNDAEANGLYHEFRKILNHFGMAAHHVRGKNFYMSVDVPVAGVAHQAGTCAHAAPAGAQALRTFTRNQEAAL